MSKSEPGKSCPPAVIWLGGLLVVGIVLLMVLSRSRQGQTSEEDQKAKASPRAASLPPPTVVGHFRPPAASAPETAEVILARKLARYSQKQRVVVDALAHKSNVTVPDDVKRFFDAIEAGNLDEAHAIFKTLSQPDYASAPRSEDMRPFWRAIQDTWGGAMMAQKMPAQEYLDYGNNILGALKPGMVYVGGTDPGMFIPNMLNATSDGEQHIVLTQNALADTSYLNYLSALYGDQLKTLTADDSQQAFQKYLADATQRLQHDEQFPDEPKQLLPGENVASTDGKVSVSGPAAVMGIDQILLQTLMQNNPDLSFGLEESFPLKSTYAGAAPLGPIMQLGAQGGSSAFTADTATQAVTYWQNTAQQLLANPEAAGSADTLLSYSHDAVAQANLLAAHDFSTQAEQAYNLAAQLAPTNFEAIAGLSTVLYQSGQPGQAIQILNDFAQRNPSQQSAVNTQRSLLAAGNK